MGHPYRLELLELLGQGEMSVELLVQRCRLPVATVSQHLQHLRRVGLVSARREGRYIFYRLADEEVVTLLSALQGAAERGVAERL